MKVYREFPEALRNVVAITQGGSQSNFAEASGMTAASISRFCSGKREISRNTLAKIAQHLPEAERRRLYLAAMRDFLPHEAKEMFFPDRQEEPVLRRENETEHSMIDLETRRILDWLNRHAEKQEEVRAWLRTLAKWIEPKMV